MRRQDSVRAPVLEGYGKGEPPSPSMIMPRINPHRLSLAGAFKSTLTVKIQSPTISDQNVLMKPFVTRHEPPHKLGANPSSLVLRQHEEV